MKRTLHLTAAISILAILISIPVRADEGKKAERTDSKKETAIVGHQAPDFTLVGIDGKEYALSDYEGKFVVLEWVNFDCPFVQKYYRSGTMQKLQSDYREKGVVWLSVCSSAPGKQGYFEGDALKERLEKEKSNTMAYLIDAEGTVGRMYNAKATPNMYVINPEGVLVYAGAIDDRPSTKVADLEGANIYVQLALDAAMAGKEIETKVTKPYGCSVKYK
jgi:peroxiredoxin